MLRARLGVYARQTRGENDCEDPKRQAALAAHCRLVGLSAAALAVGLAAPAAAQVSNLNPPAVTFAPQAAAQQDLTVRDWVKRPEMFGDWGGARTRMGERGLKVDANWTQFFQSSPTAQDKRDWNYGGKLNAKLQQDFSKQGWDGVSATMHVEFRYGDVPLLAGGTLDSHEPALLFPESEGSAARVSSLYVSKMFGTSALLQAGRFNTVDRYLEDVLGRAGHR